MKRIYLLPAFLCAVALFVVDLCAVAVPQATVFDLQHEIDLSRISGESIVIPGGLRDGKPIEYHLFRRINARTLTDVRIGTDGGRAHLVFHVDDKPLEPLFDWTNSNYCELAYLDISVVEGSASCAVLRARSSPSAQSRFNTLHQVVVDDYLSGFKPTQFGVATIVVMGAEHSEDIRCLIRNSGAPALHLASTNMGLEKLPIIYSPFGPVAGPDPSSPNDTPPVSQWLYTAYNCGFTVTGSPTAGIVVGRGTGGTRFINCNTAAHNSRAAIQLGEYGGTVYNIFYSGMIEGNGTLYSFWIPCRTYNSNLNGPTHTSKPWAQTYSTHADKNTRRSLNSMTPYAGVKK